jgi:hypothetical protein
VPRTVIARFDTEKEKRKRGLAESLVDELVHLVEDGPQAHRVADVDREGDLALVAVDGGPGRRRDRGPER